MLKNWPKPLAIALIAFFALGGAVRAADSPLADAAQAGDRATVEKLIHDGIDVNSAQVDGTTALHWAARRDDLPLAKAAIAAGASVNAENRYGVRPLSLVCTAGNTAL